jgi:hypothetical protein
MERFVWLAGAGSAAQPELVETTARMGKVR